MVNNMGGMSVLELYAVADEVLAQLEAAGLPPTRVYTGTFMTSLNSPGFSITLLNLTHIAYVHPTFVTPDVKTDGGDVTPAYLRALLDAPHASAAWPAAPYTHAASVQPPVFEADWEALGRKTRAERVMEVPPLIAAVEDGEAGKAPTLFGMCCWVFFPLSSY
jgi:hypothetical protein